MTRKEAKELTLELWRYLAEHPECRDKQEIPDDLYDEIMYMKCRCPLCETFDLFCKNCPLYKAGEACKKYNSAYSRWNFSSGRGEATRKAAAERIVEIVSAWEPEEE
jgi:hypothetical protein